MNRILSAFGAAAAVVASTAYYCCAQTRPEEVADNQSLDVRFLLNKIPVFDGSGYGIWSCMMRSLFLSQDIWDMVERGYIEEELSVEVLREVRKKDAWALLFIQQTIDASVFSCIAGAKTSKEAWDALQKKYQGEDAEEEEPNPVDLSLLYCPADATQCKEAWDALGMESQEPNQKKTVDESVLSCAADATESKEAAWDAPEQGYRANTKVVEANRIGIVFGNFNNCGFMEGFSANSISDDRGFKMNHSYKAASAFHSKLKLSEDGIGEESGDIKNNNCGSKKGSRGISNRGGRGGRNGGRFNNNRGGRGGRDGECSYNQGIDGGTDSGHFNNSRGGRGGKGRGRGHFNNWGGRGGKDHGQSNNNLGSRGGINRECFNNNQGGHGGMESGHFKNNQGGSGGLDNGCFNSKKSHSGGIDGENFNRGSEAADFNNMNAKFESKEALNAHPLQQGHQAYTVVVDDYQGGRVGVDGGCFNNKDSEFCDYNSKNPNFESVASNATELKEASDAPQQGHQANTEVKAQPQVGNPCGGKIIISRLDKAIYEEALRAKFSAFGNLVSCKVARDAFGQSKGKAYMEYDSEDAAQKAIRNVNGRLLNDKKVYVGPVVSKQEGEKVTEMTKFTHVYVGNLSESTTEEDLRKVFDIFGTIVRILVMRDGDGKSKGFGFVNFKDADDAAWCVQVLNGHKFDNKEWCVRRASHNKLNGKAQKKPVDEYVPSSTESKISGDSVPQKKFNGKAAKKKCLDESVPSSSSNASESKKAGEAVVQKGNRANTRVLYVDNKGIAYFKLKSVDEYVPSSTESKKSGDSVPQKIFNGKAAKKKCLDESVLSSSSNASESKKAGEVVVQKGNRANTRVLYVDNKGIAYFKLKSVDEYVPSSAESKKSGDSVPQKIFNGKAAKKKCLDESVLSSSSNASESKKAGEAVVQKGNRANTRVLYMDNKGIAYFMLKGP